MHVLFAGTIISLRVCYLELSSPLCARLACRMPQISAVQAKGGSIQILSSPPFREDIHKKLPADQVGQFLSVVRFDHKLAELLIDLQIDRCGFEST